jgi:hypothetical protein
MAGAGLAEVGALDVAAHEVGQARGVDGLAGGGQEDDGAVGWDDEVGADVLEVAVEPGEGALADRGDAILRIRWTNRVVTARGRAAIRRVGGLAA